MRPVLCLLVLLTATLRAAELNVAAASDLVYCLDELNAAYKKAHPGTGIKSVTGASGNLFAQIQNGGPFDIFLSADVKYPQELVKAGLAEEKSLQQYAVGHLVVWTTREGLDVSAGLQALASPNIKKFAIANPEHAPYGRAAKAALEHAKLWDGVKDKIVYGENIAQTAQFVETGNADAGIVALSLVLSPKLAKKGAFTQVPIDAYPRLEQAAVITKKGASNPEAAAYMEFLRSKEAREIFNRYGFLLPE